MSINLYVAQYVLKPKMLEVDVSRTFVVPDNVHSLYVIVQAPGGTAFYGTLSSTIQRLGGGAGGNWNGMIEVTPGETLELVVGDKTTIARAGTDLCATYRGGNARETLSGQNMGNGAGDGGFPNGSGAGRTGAISNPAGGGCAVTVSNGAGLVARPLYSPSSGGGFNHTDAIYGAGRFGGGVGGTGGRTPYPWGYGGDCASANGTLPPGPGKIILNWMEPSPRAQ